MVYPMIFRDSTIQGDAGFLPSTVCLCYLSGPFNSGHIVSHLSSNPFVIKHGLLKNHQPLDDVLIELTIQFEDFPASHI